MRAIFLFAVATLLFVPYLFYVFIFRGTIASGWALIALIAFFVLVIRLRKADLPTRLLVCGGASAAAALNSLPIGSLIFTLMLFLGGFAAMSVFAIAIATSKTSRKRIDGNGQD